MLVSLANVFQVSLRPAATSARWTQASSRQQQCKTVLQASQRNVFSNQQSRSFSQTVSRSKRKKGQGKPDQRVSKLRYFPPFPAISCSASSRATVQLFQCISCLNQSCLEPTNILSSIDPIPSPSSNYPFTPSPSSLAQSFTTALDHTSGVAFASDESPSGASTRARATMECHARRVRGIKSRSGRWRQVIQEKYDQARTVEERICAYRIR